MNAIDRLITWLDKYPPLMRILIVALVPAILVLLLEELVRPAPPPPAPPPVVEKAPVVHAFSKNDLATLSHVNTVSQEMLDAMNQAVNAASSANERICLQGVRNSVSAYTAGQLSSLQQEIAISLNMQDEADEHYMESLILNTAGVTLNAMPTMQQTVNGMASACSSSQMVYAKTTQIRGFLTETTNTLRSVVTMLTKKK